MGDHLLRRARVSWTPAGEMLDGRWSIKAYAMGRTRIQMDKAIIVRMAFNGNHDYPTSPARTVPLVLADIYLSVGTFENCGGPNLYYVADFHVSVRTCHAYNIQLRLNP